MPMVGMLTALFLLLLCWIAFFHNLGVLGLIDKTEALQGEIAMAMAAGGDWITPHWNGEPYFDKPVWPYWLGGLSLRLFGMTPWAARLPSALAASGTVALVFAFLWVLAPGQESLRRRWLRSACAASVLALNPAWMAWGRTAVHDIHLCAAITLALFGFFLVCRRPEDPQLARFGVWMIPVGLGLGVLAKGILGVAIPCAVIVVFLSLTRRLDRLRCSPGLALGMLTVFALIAVPWYALVIQANGEAFLSHFFGFSHLDRLTSVVDRHSGPWTFYGPVIAVLFLPWTPYLPAALLAAGSRWNGRSAPGALDDLGRLCLVWFLLVLVVFSAITTKLAGYILPLIPAAAVLVALLLVPTRSVVAGTAMRVRSGAVRILLQAGFLLNLSIVAGAGVAAAYTTRWLKLDPEFPQFNTALLAMLRDLALPLLLIAAIAALLALAGLAGRRAIQPVALVMLLNAAVMITLTQIATARGARAFLVHRQEPVQILARRAGALARPDEPIYVVGTPYYSFVHDSGRTIRFGSPLKRLKRMSRERREANSSQKNSATVLAFGTRRSLRKIHRSRHRIERLAGEGPYELIRITPVAE